MYYFSLPIMTKWLPPDIKSHWQKFVEIMSKIGCSEIDRNYLKDGITYPTLVKSDLIWFFFDHFQAKKRLTSWVWKFQEIYGKTNMVMNIHNLNHCVDFIVLYGPWKVFSCFPFEDMMGFIKRRVHSTKHFMKTYCVMSSLHENMSSMIQDLLKQDYPLEVRHKNFYSTADQKNQISS